MSNVTESVLSEFESFISGLVNKRRAAKAPKEVMKEEKAEGEDEKKETDDESDILEALGAD